jgi:hypothetical protein
MRTFDLRENSMSVAELLQAAREESLMILGEDGSKFILEAADSFDQEVEKLGRSEKFMAFLADRAKEPGSISLEEIENRLG